MRTKHAPYLLALLLFAGAALFASAFTSAPSAAIAHAVPTVDGACGLAGGRYDFGYPQADSADTDGGCEGDFANYQGVYEWAIMRINQTLPQCEAIRIFLIYDSAPFEWTGWVVDEVWLDAGTWGNRIGFHWDWSDSTWLWLREGAIAHYNVGAIEAGAFADMCTSYPAGAS